MPLPIKFKTEIANKLKDEEALKKLKMAKKSTPKSNNIIDILERIAQDVELNLGHYRDQYQLITDIDVFRNYINKANKHGYIAIDTETLGLNPLIHGIVGLCLYFPGEPATYVPINHANYITDERYPDQLTEADIKEVLQTLTANIIYHNAPFDIRVLKNQVGVRLDVFWDTLTAGNLLNEEEPHGLKELHGKYISHTKEKTFNDLFGKIPFKYVPIKHAYLYAAHDAIDTYELYEYQKTFLNDVSGNKYTKNLYNLFRNIEIPMINVIVDLEDNGVAVDLDYVKELHDKYQKNLDNAFDKCMEEVNKVMDKITEYNNMYGSTNKAFEIPLNISSPVQLAILFYDILKCKPLKDKGARCTDVDVMNTWSKEQPIAKAILDYRSASKILTTYVDNIPLITHTDGRVHTHFNAIGAKTGRMSSGDPLNLQNIPSHNEDIRKMFVGQTTTRDVDIRPDNAYVVGREDEVEMNDGSWKWAELIKSGDILSSGEKVKFAKISKDGFRVLIAIE